MTHKILPERWLGDGGELMPWRSEHMRDDEGTQTKTNKVALKSDSLFSPSASSKQLLGNGSDVVDVPGPHGFRHHE
jgi:hypothetical protein